MLASRGSTLFLSIGQKNPNFFGCKTRSLRSKVLSGTIKTTITRTSHGCHIIRDPTHAVTARKEISIKFSSVEKSVSEFIWAANKETRTLIIFEPRLVLALLFDPLLSTIYISPSALYCNSRFLFLKDPYCCSYGKWLRNVTQRNFRSPQLCLLSCSLFCPLRQKNWKKSLSLLSGESALPASTRELTLDNLAPIFNCWKSFLPLFSFQLNSHCFPFHLPHALTFTLKLPVAGER